MSIHKLTSKSLKDAVGPTKKHLMEELLIISEVGIIKILKNPYIIEFINDFELYIKFSILRCEKSIKSSWPVFNSRPLYSSIVLCQISIKSEHLSQSLILTISYL